MTERDTVTELIAEGTLRIDVPVDRGGELAVEAQDRLESLAAVRYLDSAGESAVHGVDETLRVSFAHQNAERSGDGRELRKLW